MVEIWKDIKGYERLYQVSNLGRVRSLTIRDRLGRTHFGKIKAAANNGNGYKTVNLKHNGKQKMHTIHRLVAEAFIPNLDNLPQVNHKDEDKSNNCVDNLEWCSIKYNNNYGKHSTENRRTHINNPKTSKPILCVETGIIYPSINEAARQLRIKC